MNIIPAIDIIDKKVVRLQRGEFDKEKVYSENPILTARKWKDLGARLLHIVDLDGARIGKPVNTDVISEIVKDVGIDIELGGGLRTEKDIDSALKIGVHFAVVGTSAVTDEAFCKRLVGKFHDKIIFAVDTKEGKVAIKGWREISEKDVSEYIKKLEELGATRIIYTDISRDGMMTGPNLETLKSILQSTSLKVTASGGISSINDIKTLKGLEKGILQAVIVGKALYEGKLDLKEALSVG
ncbi:MAG: 1-(5-phosphoribosyl)-5-[(5-phosphoribosylamino)methylideneamino]imidazole-4-carboxamide isomerase [Candidatus Omnitrophica bacterium]|nr:1-(5-phosphoribosyl)-5-[(5-phosphoribosylamino)methylideneamino]imidazole-4-carboxamide isomerase [Candidatus Omnitrophota bacterium]